MAGSKKNWHPGIWFGRIWMVRIARWFLTHDGSMVLLCMVTWIPSIYPLYVSIYTSTRIPHGHRHTSRANESGPVGSRPHMPMGRSNRPWSHQKESNSYSYISSFQAQQLDFRILAVNDCEWSKMGYRVHCVNWLVTGLQSIKCPEKSSSC